MGLVSRFNQTEAMIRLAILLQSSYRGMSIEDIAKEFECSMRTAERMKATMFDLFPDKIEEVPTNERKKRWRFKKGSINFLVNFRKEDLVLLKKLKKLNLIDKKEVLKLDELISKINLLVSNKKVELDEPMLAYLMESEGYLLNNKTLNSKNSKYLELIRSALLSDKKLEILYGETSKKSKKIILNPYGIKISDRYFLVAYNKDIKGIRQFAFDKIFSLDVLEEKFIRNRDLYVNENNYKEQHLEKIILEFDKKEKEYVLDSLFHPEQKFNLLENGNILVSFYSEISSEICLELVKWRSSVKIHAPKILKEKYKSFLEEILNKI